MAASQNAFARATRNEPAADDHQVARIPLARGPRLIADTPLPEAGQKPRRRQAARRRPQ